MGILELISSLVGSLAWPATVIVLLLILRKPVRKMLSERPVKLFKAGPSGVEVEYFIEEKIEEARSELDEGQSEEPARPQEGQGPTDSDILSRQDFMDEMKQLAAVAPSAVVLESFSRLEWILRQALDENDSNGRPAKTLSVRQLARQAVERKLIRSSEAAALNDLADVRNVVAHRGTDDLDAERALLYADAIQQIITSVEIGQRWELFSD